MTKYGFLGIGIMGKAMAANLLNEGLDLTVWNRTPERCDALVDMGAARGTSAAAVVADCDITFAMVSDPAAAEELCFGPQGVLDAVSPGKSYIDVSTVDAKTSTKIFHAIEEKGGRFLEAPVSGSKKPAETGDLVFLCSGNESLYQDAGAAFGIMGKKSFYFSQVGQGAQMKLVINMVMGTMMTALAEGLSLGEKFGLDMNKIIEVLAQGAVNNPMFQLKGPLMAEGTFPQAFPLKHMQKDMRLALLAGDELGQELFTAGTANNLYVKARKMGFSDEDFSAVMKAVSS